MKISMRKITWMTVSIAVASFAGVPALADDTELLLINPDPTLNPKPNVLFILDTSGSMTTTQDTIAPYDGTDTYSGDCETDRVYWTDVTITPVCDADNDRWIYKSSFHCKFAENQILGIGSFTNTMVQYRNGGKDGMSPGPFRWQYLAAGYNSEPVECQADSGVHGDGRATFLWAANGTNLSDPFTESPSGELSWGSAPRNLGYTFYDGNYLNWKNSPDNVTLSRSDIMKAVTKTVLSSVNNLNVGLMRFNDADGGPVILAMTDLDENRDAVLDAIDGLPADGRTPLSETLYESALYWRGMAAHYGETIDETDTDPDALLTEDPEIYKHPDWDVCAKNYNVLLTDGQPVEDFDTPTLAPTLPNFAMALGSSSCDGSEQGHCLDDVAEYLSKQDIDPLEEEDQLVTTHTIGFTIDLDILQETADDSGGEYFLADDVESLTKTLLSIIANINDRSLSFSAPAVSVNTFNRTQNLNDLYITTFGAKGKAHWPGNLKKYKILDGIIVDANDAAAVDEDTGFFDMNATSIWSSIKDGDDVIKGGAANEIPDPDSRNVYTNNAIGDLTSSINHVSVGNIDNFDASDFGLTGASSEPSLANMIRWVRGQDVKDVDNDDDTEEALHIMGDPLHSQPAAVVYGGSPTSPDVTVFTATNDGYLHAINGANGAELWSFIPNQLLPNMTRLFFDPDARYKQYGIDGNIVPIVKDVDNDGVVEATDGDFVYLIFGMRRGGETYFAIDVTDKTSPDLLWSFSMAEMGESWSTPIITRVDIDGVTQNADNAVVIFGGGYDTVHDTNTHPVVPDGAGTGVHMLDLASGAHLWRAGPDTDANLTLDEDDREMDRAIPNEIRVIDMSGNGFADRMYATDLGGQIWRFDIFNGEDADNLVTGGVIAQLGAEGLSSPSAADTRRFYNAPDVSLVVDNEQQRRYLSISVGTGYRAHPFDLSADDRFYSLRDPDVFSQLTQNEYDNYDIAVDSDFVEVSGQTLTVVTSDDRGWRFTLPDNQKILADSLTFDDQVFFVAFSPEADPSATCASGKGTNFLYRVSALNGDPVVPDLVSLDPDDSDEERRETLQQGGIAPSPTLLFPSPEPDCTGDECSPEPLYCVGVECDPPGFENNPVRTLWTQDGIE